MEKYLAPEAIGEGELSDQWLRFKREFAQFLVAVGKEDATEQVKLAIFLRIVGPRVNDLVETMRFEGNEDGRKFEVVSRKLDGLCARRSSKHVIRDKFFQLKQDGKSVDQFVMELRKQVKDCQFGDLKDDLMLYVLIRGVDNERMRRRLFETENLDLSKAIRMCQSMEAMADDLQCLAGKKVEASEGVAAVRTVPAKRMSRPKERLPGDQEVGAPLCSRCGRSHKPRQCPAYGQRCKKCQGFNHFASVCRKGSSAHLVEEENVTPTRSDEEVLMIAVEKVGKKLLAQVPFRVSGCTQVIVCQLDTAASCNILSLSDHRKLGSLPTKESRTTLTMYDGTVRKSLGRCRVQVHNRQEKPMWLEFELLETKHPTLLSLDTCLNLQLLSYEAESVCMAEATQSLTKETILKDYKDLFSGIGALPGVYDIELDDSVPPVQNRPCRIPHTMRAAVQEKLQTMEKDGWIAKVDTPTEWISNLTAVWKADKAQVRVCLDPCDLNRAIKRSHFNMPTLDDVLPTLNNAKVFSLLDVKDGSCMLS